MSVDLGTITKELSRLVRTWRVEFFTDYGKADYDVKIHRQYVDYDPNTNETDKVIGLGARSVKASKVAAKEVTLSDGTVLNGAQMVEANSLFADLIAQDELNKVNTNRETYNINNNLVEGDEDYKAPFANEVEAYG